MIKIYLNKVLFILSLLTVGFPGIANSVPMTTTENFNFILANGQITDNILPFNDVWNSGNINIQGGGGVILAPGDMYVANITFANMQHLQLDDGFINGNESIHIGVTGGGGVGGAPANIAAYRFDFTGVHGGPFLVDPVVGNATIGALNGNLTVDRDIDLINGGIVQFHDLHLKLTNNNVNPWAITAFNLGVDADVVTIGDWGTPYAPVPIPTAIWLFGTGLITLLGIAGKKKTAI